MKLLFDQNLSPRLVDELDDLFPGSVHVRDVNLASADDETVWHYAGTNELIIVSKDSDFHQRSFVYGFPPKVVWIRTGNCSTGQLIDIVREHAEDIRRFAADADAAFLEVGRP